MYLWLPQVLVAVHGLSLVAASRGYSLAVVHGLLVTVASLVEHGLQATQALQLWRMGLAAPKYGNLPRPGVEAISPALAGGSFTTGPPEKPSCFILSSNHLFISTHNMLDIVLKIQSWDPDVDIVDSSNKSFS